MTNPKRRRGRPRQRLEMARHYLLWLLDHADQHNVVHLQQRMCADAIGYATQTIKVYERILRQQGAIARRRGNVVILRRTLDEKE